MRKLITICLLLAIFVPAPAMAGETSDLSAGRAGERRATEVRQFGLQSTLADGTPFDITIVAPEFEEGRAVAACATASSRAMDFFNEIFAENGVEADINSLKKDATLKLSPEAFKFISRAIHLAKLTNGWFDFAAASPGKIFAQRDWRQFVLDEVSGTLSVKAPGMRVDLRRIAYAYIVDTAIEDISSDGFGNVKVEAGAISRNKGKDIYTPWNINIPIGDGDKTFAHRAFTYNISDIAAATISNKGLGLGLVDAHSKKLVSQKIIGSATVFAADAGLATAYAISAYTLGAKNGMKFIDSHPEVQGIIIDPKGALTISRGLNGKIRDISGSIASPPVVVGKGPNDLRRKKLEESHDR